MYSDTPRSVTVARRLVKLVALVPLPTLLIWIYTHELKPYEVRYYTQTSPDIPTKFQVLIYSDKDVDDAALVSLDCHPDSLVDVTFRPVLQEARDWSLREMFPSIPESKGFLSPRSAYLIDEIADRHLPGGLSEWEGIERIQLKNRLDRLLTKSKERFTRSERAQLEKQFLQIGTPQNSHRANQLVWPHRVSRARQAVLASTIDRMQQAWETAVELINSNWLQRWQALTTMPLAVPIQGVGGTTPLYLTVPALKEGAGVVLGIEHESSAVPQSIQVVVGDTVAYKVGSYDHLKSSSILLLIEDQWWIVSVLLAVTALCGLVYYSYWRWPKHLKTPELFKEAQKRNSDELWAELRSRTQWIDSYVVSQFFAVRTVMVPNADVISYFWRCVRDALSAHAVPATTDDEVRQAILDVLDRSIQNALI